MTSVIQLRSESSGRPLLERVIFSDLVFPLCWEDPEVDARAFEVGPLDSVVTLTSAGCNALNLLLQGPAQIFCVDANPAQNALLELKLAAIRELEWETFWEIFSGEVPTRIRAVYEPQLRKHLSPIAAAFWDRRMSLVENNICRAGKFGLFFRVVRAYLKARCVHSRTLQDFFGLTSLSEQREWYTRRLAPRLWSPLGVRVARSQPLLYLAGVHPEQFEKLRGDADVSQVAMRCVEHALTELPVRNNYFWRMLALGRFSTMSHPPYLSAASYPLLRERIDRITVVYGRLEQFLETQDAHGIDRINLRDAPDWMSPPEQATLWQHINRVSTPKSRVLQRTATRGLTIPQQACFREDRPLSDQLTFADRSATHGRVQLFAHC